MVPPTGGYLPLLAVCAVWLTYHSRQSAMCCQIKKSDLAVHSILRSNGCHCERSEAISRPAERWMQIREKRSFEYVSYFLNTTLTLSLTSLSWPLPIPDPVPNFFQSCVRRILHRGLRRSLGPRLFAPLRWASFAVLFQEEQKSERDSDDVKKE